MKSQYDIVICGGSSNFDSLRELLPLLHPHGTVHLASTRLTSNELAVISPYYDVLHEPNHDACPYENFKLFCIRDINRIVSAPYFIKMDADVILSQDWFHYVDEALARYPDAVLLGSHPGSNRIEYDISGSLVRRKLGRDIRVRNGIKANGSFYVAETQFYKQHDHTMQVLHDLIYSFRDGQRVRPSHLKDEDLENDLKPGGRVVMRGTCSLRQGTASEDNLRNLTAYVGGAGNRVYVHDSCGRVQLQDKLAPRGYWKKVKKWAKSRAGIPWESSKWESSTKADLTTGSKDLRAPKQ